MVDHVGIIYQATNWLYQGYNIKKGKSWKIKIHDEWYHPRTVISNWGSTKESVLEEVDPNFEKKIIYIVVEDTLDSVKKAHVGQNSLVERHQRNSILKGLKNCHDNDLIIISDVDEIPNLNKLSLFDKKILIFRARFTL